MQFPPSFRLFRFRALGARLVLLGALLTLSASSAAAQTEDERARARTEFERGVAAFGSGSFQVALDAFQEAYRLAPHASVRLNIAHCYQELHRPVEALFHFERYLTEATSLAGPQRREIEATIRGLRSEVGTITLQVTPDGATIVIDGGETRRAPVSDPVRVIAGDHAVVITLDGYVTERQTVHVEGGADARVAVRLRRAETVASGTGAATGTGTSTGTGTGTSTGTGSALTSGTGTVSTGAEGTEGTTGSETIEPAETTEVVIADPPPDEGGGGGIRLSTPFFIAGGVTVAAAIGWGVTGGIALSENDAFEGDVLRANDESLSEEARAAARTSGLGHADTARNLAIASDVLMVTTLVGLGATTFFFILAQTEDDGSTDDTASITVVPVLTPSLTGIGSAGVVAGGTF